jgi:hypothetical protein
MGKMKRLILLAIPITVLFIAFFPANAGADQCSKALIRAMEDEGLSESQINSICAKAETYARKKDTIFTPEKIKQDLMGKSVGPDALVKVKTHPPERTTSSSFDVFTTVPTGIVFDKTNIRSLKVLDTKITGDKARVVVHVDTVSMCAGRLRLYYERIAGEWTLLEIENLDFKQQ